MKTVPSLLNLSGQRLTYFVVERELKGIHVSLMAQKFFAPQTGLDRVAHLAVQICLMHSYTSCQLLN